MTPSPVAPAFATVAADRAGAPVSQAKRPPSATSFRLPEPEPERAQPVRPERDDKRTPPGESIRADARPTTVPGKAVGRPETAPAGSRQADERRTREGERAEDGADATTPETPRDTAPTSATDPAEPAPVESDAAGAPSDAAPSGAPVAPTILVLAPVPTAIADVNSPSQAVIAGASGNPAAAQQDTTDGVVLAAELKAGEAALALGEAASDPGAETAFSEAGPDARAQATTRALLEQLTALQADAEGTASSGKAADPVTAAASTDLPKTAIAPQQGGPAVPEITTGKATTGAGEKSEATVANPPAHAAPASDVTRLAAELSREMAGLEPLQAKADPAATPSAPVLPQPLRPGDLPGSPVVAGPPPAPIAAHDVLKALPPSAVPIEIGLKALQGIKEFQIRLDPAELGRVEVRLELGEDRSVSARVVVDRVETLHLLQRDAKTLERAFEQAGLKSSDAGIDITLRDPGQQGRRDGRGEETNPFDVGEPLSKRSTVPEPPAPVIRRMLHVGALDLSI